MYLQIKLLMTQLVKYLKTQIEIIVKYEDYTFLKFTL